MKLFNALLTVTVILSGCAGVTPNANENARIKQNEKSIESLQLQVSELRSLINNQSSSPIASNPTNNFEKDGWKYNANWRRLSVDMNSDQVLSILGEPTRINGGNLATWYYPEGGTVMFAFGKLNSWNEPR